MGQRQLIAVARAVIIRPNLLLCDEPTSNLDSKLARRLMHLFTQLRKLGTTVVLATHSDDLVDRYRHPILRIAEGRLRGRCRRRRRWPRPTERGRPMNLRRLDLPLDQTAVGRFLPWTSPALVYLAVLALAVAAVADGALRLYHLRAQLVTVTLPSVEDPAQSAREIAAALDVAAADPRRHLGAGRSRPRSWRS